MRKQFQFRTRGKYEAAAPTKTPKKAPEKATKSSPLMKTYLTSLLSLVLCVTMFLGTTMAWFTDEVGSKGNEIYVGNLTVDLVHEGVSLSRNTDHQIFGDNSGEKFYFYPGVLRVETLTVNYGSQDAKNIPFRYRLGAQLLDSAGNKLLKDSTNAEAYNLAACFEVYIHTGNAPDDVTIETIQANNSGWTDVGTLAEVLAGELLYESSKIENGYGTATHQIALYMKTDTPSDYIGKSLTNIYIYLLAYQDGVSMASNAATLDAALQKGGEVVLTQDISVVPEGEGTNLVPQMSIQTDTTLDLSGKTLSVDPSVHEAELSYTPALIEVTNGATLTINGNGIITAEAGDNNSYGIDVKGGTLIINSGSYYGALTAIQVESGSVVINGGFFDLAPTCKAQVPQYAKYVVNAIDRYYQDGTATIEIKGGTFVNFDPSANPEGTGTSYVAEGYTVVSETQTNGEIWYTVVPITAS